jgi:hypothetical protein
MPDKKLDTLQITGEWNATVVGVKTLSKSETSLIRYHHQRGSIKRRFKAYFTRTQAEVFSSNVKDVWKISYITEDLEDEGWIYTPWHPSHELESQNDWMVGDVISIICNHDELAFVYHHDTHCLIPIYDVYRDMSAAATGTFPFITYNRICERISNEVLICKNRGSLSKLGDHPRARDFSGEPYSQCYTKLQVYENILGVIKTWFNVVMMSLATLVLSVIILAIPVSIIVSGIRMLVNKQHP